MGTGEISQPQLRGRGEDTPLRAWFRVGLVGLTHPALWVALALLLVVFLIVPQLPLRYPIDVGHEEGVGSDLPFIQGFNTAERDELGTYRWTDDGAMVVMPGVGVRSVLVRLHWLPMPAAVRDISPQSYQLHAGGVSLGSMPLRAEGGVQEVVVPEEAMSGGALALTLRTATFRLPGDPRTLGARLSAVEVKGLDGGRLVAPDWTAVLTWLGAVSWGWLVVWAALGVRSNGAISWWQARGSGLEAPGARPSNRWNAPAAVLVLGVGVFLVALTAVLDPPRWAFGAGAALVACALAYPLAVGLRLALPGLARRLAVPLDPVVLGWLVLFVAMSFALRFGGRLYPDSMHGDIGFHHNRFNEAVWGLIYIVSVNRGVDFPYPPGPYLIVAPLTLVGLSPRMLLQLGAALADAVSVVVIYGIAARVVRQGTALLAAGLYIFTAATFMTTWWSFDTHIYTQCFHLLLVAALCWAFEAWQRGDKGRKLRWAGVVFVLLSLVFLGHFGFLINTALLMGLLIGAVWVAGWRGAGWARRVRWPLTISVVAAGAFAALCFYTAYIPMFLQQIQTAREGGLTAVAGRGPVSRAVMWERLWRDGLVVHFGLFPLLLMPGGVWLLARQARGEPRLSPRHTVVWLMMGSLLVALAFAVFPFVAGVTNSPRWLMFIAWVVAVSAAVAATALWRLGRGGRLAVFLMGALVLANTAWIWLSPMLWRIRPPEPF